ncbi:hypothetical protein IWX49DRAFT_350460 [Phyllosticta citricarpa]|uniref:Transmembrane protein n=1 Tax=Phyllosticta paracitricarpa TaxID=2016321 RepID=A0ABR1MVX9_9PEZI
MQCDWCASPLSGLDIFPCRRLAFRPSSSLAAVVSFSLFSLLSLSSCIPVAHGTSSRLSSPLVSSAFLLSSFSFSRPLLSPFLVLFSPSFFSTS